MANNLSRVNVLEMVGKQLQAQYGDDPIPLKKIVEEALLICNYAKSSIIPSDFCYNSVNKDPASASMANPMFKKEGFGMYKFLGRKYPFSGDVSWTPKGALRRVVGVWVNGDYKPHDSKL